MRVAGIRQVGGPVEDFDVADPRAPGDDEVLIDVAAAGVGNWDEIVRMGGWDVGRAPPMALGVEAAGVVAAMGSRSTIGRSAITCSRTHCRYGIRAAGRRNC